MTTLEWMKLFCEYVATPFKIQVGGAGWVVATNKKAIIGIPIANVFANAIDMEAFPGVPKWAEKRTTQILSAEKDPKATPVSLNALAAWCGLPMWPNDSPCVECAGKKELVCHRCGGDKEHAQTTIRCDDCDDEHICRCSTCNGDGVLGCDKCDGTGKLNIHPEIRTGKIFGIGINRELLARAIDGFPRMVVLNDGVVTVPKNSPPDAHAWVMDLNSGKALVVDIPDPCKGRILVMEMIRDVPGEKIVEFVPDGVSGGVPCA